MENKKDDAIPSTSTSTQTSPNDKPEEELELDQILEDLVSMENSEAAGYDNSDTMACLRNESYSVEQIAVLMDIWAMKFENNAQKAPEAQADRNEWLKKLLYATKLHTLLGGTVEESVQKFNDMLLAERDCGLCKLILYTKNCMFDCNNNIAVSMDSPVECPFRKTGLTYLALKEVKEEVEELHKQRCSCPDCARFLLKYDEIAGFLSLHEQIHAIRKDIGFSK